MIQTDANETAHLVTARTPFVCHYYRCTTEIGRGEDYVRAVCFPGHDANGSTVPWVMKLCVGCATYYDRPLPPRRTKRGGAR
jgi:hypothetical protein